MLGRLFLRAAPLALAALTLIVVPAPAQQAVSVKITVPAAGATVSGSDVTITFAATGAQLVAAAQATKREDLHAHVFLDVDAAPYLGTTMVIPAGNPNIIHTGALTATFKDVRPGQHTATVIIGYADHTSLQPAVSDRATFTVAAGAVGALPRTGDAPDSLALVVAALLGGIVLLGLGRTLRRT